MVNGIKPLLRNLIRALALKTIFRIKVEAPTYLPDSQTLLGEPNASRQGERRRVNWASPCSAETSLPSTRTDVPSYLFRVGDDYNNE